MITTSTSLSPPTIAVSGQGRREVRPDQVEFHFIIEGIFPTVQEAETQLHRQRNALLSALDDYRRYPARTTSGEPVIAPQRDYEHGAYVFKGFKATDHIILRAPLETGLVNAVLHSIAAQVKSTAFTVRYSSKKTAAALRSARAEAVRDARRKATYFAAAAGHQLGRLIRLTDVPASSHASFPDGVVCESVAPVEIDPESEGVTAQVHGTWELTPVEPALG